MNKFTVIRDTREKKEHGWSFEPDDYCQGTIVNKLDIGDYSILGLEGFICIERKRSIDEFAQNCIKKTWQKCMERMKTVKHAYLLFEFTLQDVLDYPNSSKTPARVQRKLKIPSKYIQKVIQSAKDNYNIHIIFCGDKLKAERYAYRLLKRAHYVKSKRLLREQM